MKKTKPILLFALLALSSCGPTANIHSSESSSYSSSEVTSSSKPSETISEESKSESSSSVESFSQETSSFESSSEISSKDESSESIVFSESESSSLVYSSSEEKLDPHTLYGSYYSDLDTWENGEDLIDKLHAIIHGGTYTPLTYSGSKTNWMSNSDADEYLYDHEFLDVVYSKDNILKSGTSTYWQREHAFCASLMTGSLTGDAVKHLGRATDFHNLFASSSNGNTSRGNKNYGVADKTSPTYTNRLNDNGNDGYAFDPVNFEPGNKDKGRLSRAIFYMVTMYNEDEYDEFNGVLMKGLTIVEEPVAYVAGDDCAFAIGNLSTLLNWSEYAVDLAEYQHNESVYSYIPEVHSDPANNVAQGNRNPYVDFPGLVDYAFGNKKDSPGSLDDLVSSYESLEIGEEGPRYCAIESAKRRYNEDEPFHLSDVSILVVNNDFSEEPYTKFSVNGAIDGEPFDKGGEITLSVVTPLTVIPYTVLVETDPIKSAAYQHLVTAKSAGNDFYNKNNQPGVTHSIDMDGLIWNVVYEEGSVQINSAALGCKFGTAAAPVKTLTFETAEDFSYLGLSEITGVYVSGASASGKSYTLSIYVGGSLIGTYGYGYIDTSTPIVKGKMLDSPMKGKVKIAITNITNAVYVQYLAIHAK